MALLALAVLTSSDAQSAAAQGLRVGAASVGDAAKPDVCGQSDARTLGDAGARLCQRLAAVVAERPRLSRRPSPAWSAAYDSLLADALEAVRSSSQPVTGHTVLLDLVRIGLEPGLLRWRPLDIASIHQALGAPSHRFPPYRQFSRACVEIGVTVRDFPAARECAIRALRAGEHSTWHLLRLAWLESSRGDSQESRRIVELAVDAAQHGSNRDELLRHVGPALDLRGFPRSGYDAMLKRVAAGLANGFSDSAERHLRGDVVGLLSDWMGASEFWGGAFYGCPYFVTDGGLGTTKCDRTQLPPARANTPQPGAMQLPIAEFWDPTSGEEMVAIAGLSVGQERTGPGGVLRYWSTNSALDGQFTEIPVERLRSAAAGRVVVAAVPRGVQSWFFDAGELESGESRLTGLDDADLGRGRSECISDLFLVPSDDPDLGLGSGWVGKVPFADVLRRHQPALLGVQYRRGDTAAQAVVAGRVTITALEGRQGDVSMSIKGGPTGVFGELSVGLDIGRLRPGRYRAAITAAVPGCSGEQQAFREFKLVE
jgi:hypothetical protein